MATLNAAAVATSASATPGATAARLPEPRVAMPTNALITPSTVPRSPMSGLADPIALRERFRIEHEAERLHARCSVRRRQQRPALTVTRARRRRLAEELQRTNEQTLRRIRPAVLRRDRRRIDARRPLDLASERRRALQRLR